MIVRAFSLATAFVLATSSCTTPPTPDLAPWPKTRAEASNYRETSTHAEVLEFVDAVVARDPRQRRISLGRTTQGRDLAAVLVADPPVDSLEALPTDPREKILIVANIHAGEVEGKEAVQELLRELAQGLHVELPGRFVLGIVPDYNPDGNDAIEVRARPEQAGPAEGVGQRPNGQGLDLNRDFVKVDAPETEALLRFFRTLDPLLTIDCHTTDGSYHGFDLTYAGPLSPASDPELLSFARSVFLPELRARLRRQGFEAFDYGNWKGEWLGVRQTEKWETYDHLPRYGTNYVGVCNRLSLLSEAYTHAPFSRRIAVTKALVVIALQLAREQEAKLRALAQNADLRTEALPGTTLDLDAHYAAGERVVLPASSVVTEIDAATGRTWLVDSGVHRYLDTEAQVHFAGHRPIRVPKSYVVPHPTVTLVNLLDRHGIRYDYLIQPERRTIQRFDIEGRLGRSTKFQGRTLTSYGGAWQASEVELPVGTLRVSTSQRLGRLVVLLFEPEAPDGLLTWGLLLPIVNREGGAPSHAAWRELAGP